MLQPKSKEGSPAFCCCAFDSAGCEIKCEKPGTGGRTLEELFLCGNLKPNELMETGYCDGCQGLWVGETLVQRRKFCLRDGEVLETLLYSTVTGVRSMYQKRTDLCALIRCLFAEFPG